MKIIFDRAILTAALTGVSRAVAARSTVPAVEGILCTAEENSVSLVGYDFELAITTKVEADVKQPGAYVLNSRLLCDFVRKVDGDKIIIEVADGLSAKIKCGQSEISFSAIPASDFPDLPAPAVETSLSIGGSDLRWMIEKTLYAVSQSDQRPIYNGSKFILEDNQLTVVSVDGNRLAICRRPIVNNMDKGFVVPARTLSELAKLLADEEGDIFINTALRYAVFYLPKYTITTRLLEGEFLDYKKSIPGDCTTTARVKVKDMLTAVDRASLIITERLKGSVIFNFVDDKITINCTTMLGHVYDEIDAEIKGEPMKIGFNSRFVTDALRNSGSDELVFEMKSPVAPVKVRPVSGDDFLYLLLPIRIQNENN